MQPTKPEQAVIEEFLKQPKVAEVFISTPKNIERVFNGVKSCWRPEDKVITVENLWPS
jgi:hypothetical protein